MIIVVCGVACRDGRYLMALRKPEADMGGLWEFPGGKLEYGESYSEALKREFAEELGVHVETVSKHLGEQTFLRPSSDRSFLVSHWSVVIPNDSDPQPLASSEIRWLTAKEIRTMRCVPSVYKTLDILEPNEI